MKRIPVVYVAGPFPHKSAYMPGQQDCWEIQQNIMAAAKLSLHLWRLGAVALCPHLNTAFFQNAAEDQVWLRGDLELLSRCDAVLMTTNWRRSTGAKYEHEFAKTRNIPVLYSTKEAWAFIQNYERRQEHKIA